MVTSCGTKTNISYGARMVYEDIRGRCQHETETGCLCMEIWPCPYHTSHDQLMNAFGISRAEQDEYRPHDMYFNRDTINKNEKIKKGDT